jgi:hypothetical protein
MWLCAVQGVGLGGGAVTAHLELGAGSGAEAEAAEATLAARLQARAVGERAVSAGKWPAGCWGFALSRMAHEEEGCAYASWTPVALARRRLAHRS